MSQIRISRPALTEVEQALNAYRELVAEREQTGLLATSTAETYLLHSGNFVKWLRGEFDPGSRNK